jgi:DNA-directed RNA polymerases I, II, and III subunit RPABC2
VTTIASLCKLPPTPSSNETPLTPHSNDEPAFDEDPDEYYEPEPEPADEDDAARAPEQEGENQDADHVVASGDPNAAANHGRGNEKSHKDKKIPNDQRTTTPFMTKYEKARILGTRALQIRWVVFAWQCEG